MELKFAFAVNTSNHFIKNHFGDADKFLLYQSKTNEFKLVDEIDNTIKQFDEAQEHGSGKKGNAIIQLLKENQVDVLVSMQFGRNIKMVNQHFIPIVIYVDTIDEVVGIISKHLHWIEDEWKHKDANYNLFTIKNGVLKSKVKKK